MNSTILRFLLLLMGAGLASAQLETDDAHVNLYFPVVIDGGPAATQWVTVFTFSNPGGSQASVDLNLIANDGKDLPLDFGNGAGARWSFTVPAYATRSFTTKGTASNPVTGWATAFSGTPLHAWASLRQLQTGNVRYEAFSDTSLPSMGFVMAVQGSTLVSIANVYDSRSDDVTLTLRGTDGKTIAQSTIKVPGSGRVMFQVSDYFTSVTQAAAGVLHIVGATPQDVFVAGGISRDAAGNYFAVRAGKYNFPIPHWDRIWLVFQKIVEVAKPLISDADAIELVIDESQTINALAQSGKKVTITLALAELLGDSPSELAFVIGHEIGHIYQQQTNKHVFISDNAEFDADMWALLLSMSAGYDPYAGSGSLSKLAMATGQAGLVSKFEDQTAADAHKSLTSRADVMYGFITLACSYSTEVKAACELYKSVLHPHFPDSAPLAMPGRAPATSRDKVRKLELQ